MSYAALATPPASHAACAMGMCDMVLSLARATHPRTCGMDRAHHGWVAHARERERQEDGDRKRVGKR